MSQLPLSSRVTSALVASFRATLPSVFLLIALVFARESGEAENLGPHDPLFLAACIAGVAALHFEFRSGKRAAKVEAGG